MSYLNQVSPKIFEIAGILLYDWTVVSQIQIDFVNQWSFYFII